MSACQFECRTAASVLVGDLADGLLAVLLRKGRVPLGQANLALAVQEEHKVDLDERRARY